MEPLGRSGVNKERAHVRVRGRARMSTNSDESAQNASQAFDARSYQRPSASTARPVPPFRNSNHELIFPSMSSITRINGPAKRVHPKSVPSIRPHGEINWTKK